MKKKENNKNHREEKEMLTTQQRKQSSQDSVHKAIKYAKASVQAEGFQVTAEDEELLAKYLRGEITEKQYLKQVYTDVLETLKKKK
jgi:Antitoxin VbhA